MNLSPDSSLTDNLKFVPTFQAAGLAAKPLRITCSTDEFWTASHHLTDSFEIRLKVFSFVYYPDTPHQSFAILALGLYTHCTTKL